MGTRSSTATKYVVGTNADVPGVGDDDAGGGDSDPYGVGGTGSDGGDGSSGDGSAGAPGNPDGSQGAGPDAVRGQSATGGTTASPPATGSLPVPVVSNTLDSGARRHDSDRQRRHDLCDPGNSGGADDPEQQDRPAPRLPERSRSRTVPSRTTYGSFNPARTC